MNYEIVINSIAGPLSTLFAKGTYEKLRWFVSFGSLLKFVRDKGNLEGEDLDISIFYEDYDQKRLEEAFGRGNLEIEDVIVDDRTGKPLHYSLSSTRTGFKYCVFAWIKHKGIRWHTYDYRQEGRGVPSSYVFKGVPAEMLEDEVIQVNFPGTYRNVNIPVNYGSLMDYWYPDWKTPRKGVSETKYLIEMKSCKGFEKKNYDIKTSKWWEYKYKWGEKV